MFIFETCYKLEKGLFWHHLHVLLRALFYLRPHASLYAWLSLVLSLTPKPQLHALFGLLATKIQQIFSGWNTVLRAKIRGGWPPLSFSCLVAFLAFQRDPTLHASKSLSRVNLVSFRTTIFDFHSFLCHAKCLPCMCLITPCMALQSNSLFLHTMVAYQWLFGPIFTWFIHWFLLVWWDYICFIYLPCKPWLLVKIACYFVHHASIFWPCFELEMFMFWDCLGSVFMLHDQIMHALYSYKSFHVPSFEFRVSSHASGAIFPCFGAV